jgi:hypothetical protein
MLKIVEGSAFRPFPFVKKPEKKNCCYVQSEENKWADKDGKKKRRLPNYGSQSLNGTPNGGGGSRTPFLIKNCRVQV